MSRESAGAAIRALRESRDWSLADLAAATGVSTMGLSYLERGARKPHKSTVQKVENGLGLPPGTYSRLLVAADPDAELARLIAAQPSNPTAVRRAGAVVVDRHSDTDVLEGYAEAQLDAIKSVIDRLPATTSNEYETYILSVIAQCAGRQPETADPRRVWCPHPTPVADCLRRTVDERDSTARPRCNSLLPLIRVVTCLDCVDEGSDAGERARRDDAPIADIPHFVGADAD